MTIIDAVQRRLWSAPERTADENRSFQDRAHLRSILLVRIFYAAGLYWMAQSMGRWPELRDSAVIEPQWPAGWVDGSDPRTGITAVLVLYAAAAIAAATFPRLRITRIAYTLGLLQYMSLTNGLGKIGHGFHGWLWVSAFLILLPADRISWRPDASARAKQTVVLNLMLAQMVLLSFYTLTGFWKVAYATRSLFGSGVSGFELDGFSYIIGENLLATGRQTLIGDVLVLHPVVGWAMYVGTMYLELMALLIVFRPRLHRVWGFGLIMFHIGTQAAMGIFFPANTLLLGILLLSSPVVPEQVSVREAMLDLPGVRLASRAWRRWQPRPARSPTASSPAAG